MSANYAQTVKAFDRKWEQIPDYRLETEAFYRRWFFERFGFQTDDDVIAWMGDAQQILDAGCGLGRDAAYYASLMPGSKVLGVDTSARAIARARNELADVQNLQFLCGDMVGSVTEIYGFEAFDRITCDQALHHTENPEQTLTRLLALLRPGGKLLGYVYRQKGPIREFSDDLLRGWCAGRSEPEILNLCRGLTELGKALSGLPVRNFSLSQDIEVLGIRAGEYDVQRFVFYHLLRCYWSDEHSYMTNVMDQFDWLAPAIAHRFEAATIRQWLDRPDLQTEHFDVSPSGISFRVQKLIGAPA